jgi:hypothetical protein
VVVYLSVVGLQICDYGIEVEFSLKAIVLTQLVHLILKIFLLHVTTFGCLVFLLIFLFLFLGLPFLFVVPDKAGGFMKTNNHEPHNCNEDIFLHVLGDVVQE